jgi:hypothetical protein
MPLRQENVFIFQAHRKCDANRGFSVLAVLKALPNGAICKTKRIGPLPIYTYSLQQPKATPRPLTSICTRLLQPYQTTNQNRQCRLPYDTYDACRNGKAGTSSSTVVRDWHRVIARNGWPRPAGTVGICSIWLGGAQLCRPEARRTCLWAGW